MNALPAPATTFLLALVAAFLFGSCATTGLNSNHRAARNSLENIENAMNAYHAQNGRWPANVGVLQNFAAQRGRSIDLAPFSKLSISPVNSRTVLVRVTTLPPEPREVVFATTRTPVN